MKIKRLPQLMLEDISGLTLQIPLTASHEEKIKSSLSFVYNSNCIKRSP